MKLLLFIILLLCVSCGGKNHYFANPNYSYAPSMRFAQTAKNTWEIFTPPAGVWTKRGLKAYLPEYFSEKSMWEITHRPINFFYAKHRIEESASLALWVRFLDAFYDTERIDYVTGFDSLDTVAFKDNRKFCVPLSEQTVVIGFNAVDIDFDNSAVYFLKNGRNIQGTEKPHVWLGLKEIQTYPYVTYNLADKKIIQERQPYSGAREPFTYPTFYFDFPLSCADLEDAVFVIDGLYRHGERLPPLTVKLNYLDFSTVPQ